MSDEEPQYNDQPMTKVRTSDALDTEFRFYSKLIKEYILLLSKQEDREAVLPWIHKLSTSAYNISQLRDKRNRFMLMLCISLLMGAIEGPFVILPPAGILPDVMRLERPITLPFDWELDQMWEEIIESIRELEISESSEHTAIHRCWLHRKKCPADSFSDKLVGGILDKQFRFLLYICKPYAAMLIRSSDRIRSAKWIQFLCSIDKNYCSISKGIRNDYMMVLSGYLTNQTLIGPFTNYPIDDKLMPLKDFVLLNNSEPKCITDPTHPRSAEFFLDLPHPEEGAFAYIAITGDLYVPKF